MACKTASFGMCSVGAGAPEGLDGAVYGAFASKTPVSARLFGSERPPGVPGVSRSKADAS